MEFWGRLPQGDWGFLQVSLLALGGSRSLFCLWALIFCLQTRGCLACMVLRDTDMCGVWAEFPAPASFGTCVAEAELRVCHSAEG